MDRLDSILRGARGLRPPAGVSLPPVPREIWDRAVGSRIALRAQPLRLERGVLLIRVTNTAWANELSLLGDEIRRQLAACGMEVDGLRFVVGRVDAPARPAQPRRRAAPPDAPLPAELRAPMAKVVDPELRAALEGAAARMLHIAK
jgi:hypothetical protein